MKPIITTVLRFASVAVFSVLASCVTDEKLLDPEGGNGNAVPATLSFSPMLDRAAALSPATRAGYPGDAGELGPGDGMDGSDAVGAVADRSIGSFRVLMYDSGTGALVKDLDFEIDASNKFPVTAEVLTGTYDFYFIANWDIEGASMRNALDASEATVTSADLADFDISTRMKLERLLFVAGSSPALYGLAVPMLEVVRGVMVKGDNLIRLAGDSDDTSGVWPVELTRAFMRLSLNITLTPGQYASLADNSVEISHVPSASFFMQGKINDPSGETDGGDSFTIPFRLATETPADPDLLYGIVTENKTGTETTGYTIRYDRVILPELLFSDKDNPNKAMLLSIGFDGGAKWGEISLPIEEGAEDYTIPRNTWLHLDVTVKDDELLITPEVIEWNGAVLADVLVAGDYTLEVDSPEMIFLAGGGPGSVGVRTNAPDGWKVESIAASNWFSVSGTTMSGPESTDFAPIEASATPNGGSAVRSTEYLVTAYGGKLRKTIIVKQLTDTDDTVPEEVTMYVGAFWKHDQTGERLIRIPRPASSTALDGDWSASVVVGSDWIVLDKMMTDDANVGWLDGAVESNVANGNDPGFDQTYSVNSIAKWIGGTLDPTDPYGEIFFRIGLTSEYMPTAAAPARYGIVVLSYADGTKFQRIWIRQGEDPDYLMHDGDPDIGTGSRVRTGTAQFSPYNLTAALMSESSEYVSLEQSGGAPVEYPTQAGAMFQFASSTPRRAYHPTKSPDEWNTATDGAWGSDQETCPPGYRRPDSGSTRGTSEMAMSIMADLSSARNSETPNSAWGYYADGFFDRRATEKQTSETVGGNLEATSHSAVATDTKDVAYVGRLFYNPVSSSSIFFPASGMLEYSDGSLHNAGSYGHYWSRTVSGDDNGRTMSINRGTSIPNPTPEPRSKGYSVRCVVDPSQQPPEPQNKRITWDDTEGRYALTTDPTDAGLYFKFGGVTGIFTGDGEVATLPAGVNNGDNFDPADVAWSPVNITDTGNAQDDWNSIPMFGGNDFADYPAESDIDADYHSAANVKAGKGDPCRLVGLDLAHIAATAATSLTNAEIDNGLWRLPTKAEWPIFTGHEANVSHTAHWTTLSGVAGGMFPDTDGDATTFLPALGERNYVNIGGSVIGMGNNGFYWSSTVRTEILSYGLGFNNALISSLYNNGHHGYGWPVRCVRQ